MTDLVKRLRSRTPNMVEGHAAMSEAATRIEELEARVAAADKLAEALCAEEETAGQGVRAKLDACEVTDNALAAYQTAKEQNDG